MRRLFWLALGATVGVLVVRKVSKTAAAYSPSGMAQGLSGGLSDLGEGLREMADAVREGMAEREAELRFALGMDTGTLPDGRDMTPAQARALIEDPTSPRVR
ncbi:MAG: hypothetical protein QOE58_2924 [Actinomycetota bacterium]|jgi:hypothetical protein|nr:hypothetical protein [Actinomycetota bacterium]